MSGHNSRLISDEIASEINVTEERSRAKMTCSETNHFPLSHVSCEASIIR
jgi:hypothetical protein